MRLIRKRGPRQTVALFSIAALALAATGIVYAHWTKTLDLHADINTGVVNMEWSPAGTDDDGIPGNDPSGLDIGDPPGPNTPSGTLLDMHGIASSNDPAGRGGFDRYDKDVGICVAERLEGNMVLSLAAKNTYPSYWCTLFTDVTNTGSIPVKAAGVRFKVEKVFPDGSVLDVTDRVIFGPPHLLDLGAALGPDLRFDFGGGIPCGTQIDPRESIDVFGWFHVEQGAMQGSNYRIWLSQDFVNWNEWNPEMCTFNGVLVPPPIP